MATTDDRLEQARAALVRLADDVRVTGPLWGVATLGLILARTLYPDVVSGKVTAVLLGWLGWIGLIILIHHRDRRDSRSGAVAP